MFHYLPFNFVNHVRLTQVIPTVGIAVPSPGIPTEFSNPVIPGLAASNPGIMGLKKLFIRCL